MRCLLLALTIHDINKIPEYGKRSNGWNSSYANAAKAENIEQALESLDAHLFFPRWKDFLADITFLAHAHQVTTGQFSSINQKDLDKCRLDPRHLNGPLKHLMKFTDLSDDTHQGDYAQKGEIHIREKLKNHINAALSAMPSPIRYRLIGHRLAELRGFQTNIMHNEIRNMLIEMYGAQTCIDLLCRPEGIDYLLDKNVPFNWSPQHLRTLAERIAKKFAQMQERDLDKFVRATPSGISVDDAAIQSGAPIEKIFGYITGIAERKRYSIDWQNQRDEFLHNDLEKAHAKMADPVLLIQIEQELHNDLK